MGISETLPHLSPPIFLPPLRPLLLLLVAATATAFLALLHLPTAATAADLYSLIYKGCANQTLPPNGQQTLASLSSSLISQSSAAAKFFKTTASGQSSSSIFGLFQCRGDLSPSDCAACVGRIPTMWDSLCGPVMAARVHLTGCYGLYEISGYPQVSGTKMLYKVCGSSGGGGGFEEKRDTAFSNLESGMATAGGFYATSYGNVYAMAQCEGDLSAADCGECVTEAVQKAEVECGGASSGQMYLDKCYVSYSYYPNGAPHGGGGGSGQPTGKTVAIVVGGAAGLGFLVICLLFLRSLYKKREDY